jgi:bacteriocin biosynthesis cyclodehydratase domain-containing protein
MTEFLKNTESREAIVSAARYAQLGLPDRPRLAPWLVRVDLGDTRLQLRSAESSHTLAHPLLIQVFRKIEALLDGRHTVAEILSFVDSDFLPTTVVFLLQLLKGKGLLQPGIGESTLDETEQAHWQKQLLFLSHFVPDASSAQSMLAKARVGLVGSDDLRQAIFYAMSSIGIGDVAELREPSKWCDEAHRELASLDLIVACEESPAFAFFDAVNRTCLVSGTRWLRVSIAGTSAQLGPTVVPNQTACYTCFGLRLRAHHLELDGCLAYQAPIGTLPTRTDEGSISPFWSVVAGQAALEIMRLLTGFASPVTIGRFYELSTVTPAAISHEVLRVPRCTSCGRRRTVAEAWDQSFASMDIES